MTLQTDEKEFSVLINAADRSTAEIFTDDEIWIERLKRAGWQPTRTKGVSAWFVLPVRKIISLKQAVDKPMSDKRLAVLTRMQDARKASRSILHTMALEGENSDKAFDTSE